jgi:phosphatidylinositol alpha 1,6-mannosyltransferase
VKVAIVSESFLPHVNGVSNSVCRVLEHLERRGHEAVLVAPAPAPRSYAGSHVVGVPSVPLPGYAQVRIGLARPGRVGEVLARHRPDVVYLASPFVLGFAAAKAAQQHGLPLVAVYQTDVAGFARQYHLRATTRFVWRRIREVHRRAAVTLAPSRAAVRALVEHGVPRVALWGRGVDAEQFHPGHRDGALRARLAPGGEVIVGYVGRLAPEKQLSHLRALQGLRGVRLVLVGDGPDRANLQRMLPEATFLGFLRGAQLSSAVASLDVAVHPGEHETFCQAVQEALASGVPAVAVRAGGPADLVKPAVNGELYRPGDLNGLRRQVARLALDEPYRHRLAQQARPSVIDRSWDAIGDDLLHHLERARGARPHATSRAA